MSNDVIKKLNRIEGQVGGIKKMCGEGKSCLEVVQQIAAARSALTSVARDILASEACKTAGNIKRQKNFDRIIKSLIEVT